MDQIITGAEQSAPAFVLRDLKSTDVWQLVRVISKIGLKDFYKTLDTKLINASRWKPPMMIDIDGNEVELPRDRWTEAQIDAEMRADMANDELLWAILGQIMDHIGNCELEVNKLLAMGTGQSVEQIMDMDADRYMELIVTYISREGFKDFFTAAWRLVEKVAPSKKSYGAIMETLTN